MPIALWAVAGAALMIVAAAAGFDPLAAETWIRADSKHYLTIAADGYDLYPCDSGSAILCGDAGWFGAYPWMVGGFGRLGFDLPPAAVAAAWLFSLATLVLLWRTFLAGLPVEDRLAPMVLAAFVPGQIYHRAAFPLSMLVFFELLSLWLLSRRRYGAAGAAGAVAAAELTDLERLVLGLVLLTWAFPLTQENMSLYRAEAALVPVAVLLRTVPRRVAGIAILLAVPMSLLFFQTRLV